MMTREQIKTKVLSKFENASDIVRPCTLTRYTTPEYDPESGPGAAAASNDAGYLLWTSSVLAKRVAVGREVEPNAEGAMATGFDTIFPEENDEITVDAVVYRVADSRNYMHIDALFELMLVRK